MACLKKFAARQGRVIVLIDESGLSERPCRARTWAPKGETPVLQYSFSWKHLSVIAGLTYWRFYFRLFNGSIKRPADRRVLEGPAKDHRPKAPDHLGSPASAPLQTGARACRTQHGRIALASLPTYAPELNPIECIWGYLNHHATPNYRGTNLKDVAHRASGNLRSMQRRPRLITAFWKQAEPC